MDELNSTLIVVLHSTQGLRMARPFKAMFVFTLAMLVILIDVI